MKTHAEFNMTQSACVVKNRPTLGLWECGNQCGRGKRGWSVTTLDGPPFRGAVVWYDHLGKTKTMQSAACRKTQVA